MILTLDEVRNLHGRIFIDFETTGLDPYHDEALGLGIWAEDAGVIGYLPWREVAVKEFHEVMRSWRRGSHVGAHNAKFELHYLQLDWELLERFHWFDTQVAEHLINEDVDLDLAACETRRLGTHTKKHLLKLGDEYGGIKNIADWPEQLTAEYCINDCRLTKEIAAKQAPYLRLNRHVDLFKRLMLYLKNLYMIERRGLLYDPEAGAKLKARMASVIEPGEELLTKVLAEYGVVYTEAEFKYTSPQKLSNLLYQTLGIERPACPPELMGSKKAAPFMTKTGTAKEVLALIDHPVVPIILELKKVRKIGSYLKSYESKGVPEANGLAIHPSFNITGTVTARLSCSNPNMQQVSDKPVGKLLLPEGEEPIYLRRVFRARPGHKLVSIDYKQMEVVKFAIRSQDPKMLEIVRSGGDMHAGVAKMMFGAYDERKRKVVKTLNFGLLYGLGDAAMAMDMGVSLAEAQQYKAMYMSTFSRVRPYMREIEQRLGSQGYIRYWSGRMRRIADRRFHYRGVNSDIQGGCADIVAEACNRVSDYLRTTDRGGIIAIIHDEFLLELREDGLLETIAKVRELMSVPDLLGTAFLTDCEYGDYWAAPEVKL